MSQKVGQRRGPHGATLGGSCLRACSARREGDHGCCGCHSDQPYPRHSFSPICVGVNSQGRIVQLLLAGAALKKWMIVARPYCQACGSVTGSRAASQTQARKAASTSKSVARISPTRSRDQMVRGRSTRRRRLLGMRLGIMEDRCSGAGWKAAQEWR